VLFSENNYENSKIDLRKLFWKEAIDKRFRILNFQSGKPKI